MMREHNQPLADEPNSGPTTAPHAPSSPGNAFDADFAGLPEELGKFAALHLEQHGLTHAASRPFPQLRSLSARERETPAAPATALRTVMTFSLPLAPPGDDPETQTEDALVDPQPSQPIPS